MYRDALVSGFVNISVYFNKKADNFETASQNIYINCNFKYSLTSLKIVDIF